MDPAPNRRSFLSRDLPPVVVVGSGLAGLSCAGELTRHSHDVLVLESADDIGGRVRTDIVNGFRCDRGFQVYLTSYPEPRRRLDHDALQLGRFSAGSLIQTETGLQRLADPWREPRHAVATLRSHVGSFADKLRIARLRSAARRFRSDVQSVADHPSIQELQARGFSPQIIDRFFRPFMGGIFLDQELVTSARMLMFTFGMFADGDASLPANGMGAIPMQLAAPLPKGAVRLNTQVTRVAPLAVETASGERIEALAVVVAADEPQAATLTGSAVIGRPRGSTTVYFTALEDPIGEPTLVLNGSGGGQINSVTCLTAAQPSYSSDGRALISVALKAMSDADDVTLTKELRRELSGWFSNAVHWQFLRRYDVPYSLPDQSAGTNRPAALRRDDELIVCGDHRSFGSIHHAMVSGREAAEVCLRSIANA